MPRFARLVPLVLVIGLVAPACGDGADGTERSTEGSGATAPSSSAPAAPSPGGGEPTVAETTEPPVADPTEQPAFDPAAVTVARGVEPVGRTIEGTLETTDGRVRSYRIYVPSRLAAASDPEPVPLLLAFHGGGGWGAQFEANSGFDRLAEANGFLVAYPDGTGREADGSGTRTWNGGACCGYAAAAEVDDVGFVAQLLDELAARYPVDAERVVAAGHSNGGILSYRLACELADRIAAIGVQSAALEVEACRPSAPISVLHLHGDADQNLPIDGGRGPRSVSGVDYTVPIEGAATLAAAAGCEPEPERASPVGRADLAVTTWVACDGGAEVAFVAVDGASHAWMGSTIAAGPGGEPFADLDTSLQLWNFLSRQVGA